jgi:hypothetical protein
MLRELEVHGRGDRSALEQVIDAADGSFISFKIPDMRRAGKTPPGRHCSGEVGRRVPVGR